MNRLAKTLMVLVASTIASQAWAQDDSTARAVSLEIAALAAATPGD